MAGELDFLLEPGPGKDHTLRWARVVSVAPLTVRLDGETAPLTVPPRNLLAGVEFEAGQGVLLLLLGGDDRDSKTPYILGQGHIPEPPPFPPIPPDASPGLWSTIAPINGWSHLASPLGPMQYRRSLLGIQFRGNVGGGTMGSPITNIGAAVFDRSYNVGSIGAGPSIGRIMFSTNGNITPEFFPQNGWVSFDNIFLPIPPP